jgi:hypothetical protein
LSAGFGLDNRTQPALPMEKQAIWVSFALNLQQSCSCLTDFKGSEASLNSDIKWAPVGLLAYSEKGFNWKNPIIAPALFFCEISSQTLLYLS